MSKRFAAILVLCAAVVQAQTYDSSGRLMTTAAVTNTSATATPVASRLTDGSAFIVPVLDTTLTARFPVGSTPADNESNAVTITRSGAFTYVFDGTTWDRWTGAVTATNTSPTVSPIAARLTNGTGFVDIPGASMPADDQASQTTTRIGTYMFAWDTTTGWDRFRQYVTGQTDSAPYGLVVMGRRATTFDIVPLLADGSNRLVVNAETGTLAATQSGSWTVQPGNTPNTTPWLTSIHDGTNKAAVLNLATNDPLAVAVMDGSGNQITSFGGGVQYTEADTDATITGTAMMWEDAADTLRAVSSAKPLPVNVVAGGAGDGAIQDGATPAIEATVLDFTNSNPLAVRLTDTNGDYVGAGAGTQYQDGAAQATPTGTVALGHDGTNVRAITTDASGDIQIDVLTMPTTTVTATDLDIRNLTATDTVTVTDGAGALNVIVDSSALPTGASTLAEQQTQTTALQIIDNLPVAQASTTAGQSGALVQGAVTTSAPTYTTGQTNPISLQTDGSQRVAITNTPTVTANAGTDLNTSALLTTTAHDAAFGIAGTADTQVRTVQGIAGGTALPVSGTFWQTTQPVSGTFWQTTQPVSIEQTGNNNAVDVLTIAAGDTNIGNVDIVTMPSVTIGTFPDNEPINVAQKGGTAVVAGPCEREVPLYAQVDQTSGEQIITGTASERVYICSIAVVTATAQNLALVDGTGTVCATTPTGLLGGSTAATGQNFAANGGWVLPSAPGAWAKTSTDADNVCILQSGAGQVSGIITYVSIPNI